MIDPRAAAAGDAARRPLPRSAVVVICILAAGLLVAALEFAPWRAGVESLHAYVRNLGARAVGESRDNAYWVLAVLPGLMAVVAWRLSVPRAFRRGSRSVVEYALFKLEYDRERGRQSVLDAVGDLTDAEEIARTRRVRTYEIVLGALIVSMPFLVAAWLFNHSTVLLGNGPGWPEAEEVREAVKGMFLAGCGAYLYILLLLAYRIRETAISMRFLMTSSLRASTAMVLGFLAGVAGLFSFLDASAAKPLVYVMIGAFPAWAVAAIRRKARELLMKKPEPGTEPLHLTLIDGIDDLTAERLSELGISDIQHLATSDAADLMLRTLYPFGRVIDWIDQAILVTYLKDHIIKARELSIRGAIDMRGAYRTAMSKGDAQDATASSKDETSPPAGTTVAGEPSQTRRQPAQQSPGERARASCNEVLCELAKSTGLAPNVVYNIGAALEHDYQVCFLAALWHHRGAVPGVADVIERAVEDALATRPAGRQTIRESLEAALRKGPLDKDTMAIAAEPLSQLEKALNDQLDSIRLGWKGRVEDLEGVLDVDGLERELCLGVRYRPTEAGDIRGTAKESREPLPARRVVSAEVFRRAVAEILNARGL